MGAKLLKILSIVLTLAPHQNKALGVRTGTGEQRFIDRSRGRELEGRGEVLLCLTVLVWRAEIRHAPWEVEPQGDQMTGIVVRDSCGSIGDGSVYQSKALR